MLFSLMNPTRSMCLARLWLFVNHKKGQLMSPERLAERGALARKLKSKKAKKGRGFPRSYGGNLRMTAGRIK
ncbi:hypothetical protein MGG_15683 [Pyricularia oryzae 70-15]|uniref:Uncharacterized protein n=2 Tax=Pyricularia oryzae TaxID=318829 RepID=G4MZ28_PYRO7|nr:uncharacterized protein MGG_15683 [Pyricularia oryzae 70-15]EHA54495.1 hypothetical protein MGG_15683 [Pyricularia oryzae 70-15]ELQ41979.1 hypothetical protein OOU_Y34scaffold00245g30 [Pyricularia oryzae Y34]KAI7931772.1 hypothetical protein M9X92_000090 [Pyricularia oryzae]KAI7932825.1 hypothetical protein M0657_000134 [Pyricularia oryzae]